MTRFVTVDGSSVLYEKGVATGRYDENKQHGLIQIRSALKVSLRLTYNHFVLCAGAGDGIMEKVMKLTSKFHSLCCLNDQGC